jgi:hypothetical protein
MEVTQIGLGQKDGDLAAENSKGEFLPVKVRKAERKFTARRSSGKISVCRSTGTPEHGGSVICLLLFYQGVFQPGRCRLWAMPSKSLAVIYNSNLTCSDALRAAAAGWLHPRVGICARFGATGAGA